MELNCLMSRHLQRSLSCNKADSEKNQKEAETAGDPQTPAVMYNKVLLAKYEDAGRPLMELMLSGTGHEDEIQKGIADMKKAMEGAPKTK